MKKNRFWDFIENIIEFFVKKLRLSNSDQITNNLIQFIKFGLVGISNTLISYITYLICLQFGMHYTFSHVAGFVVGVTNSFYWNNKYVFTEELGKKRSVIRTYIKTILSYAGTGLFLANGLLFVWIDLLDFPVWIGPLLNLFITIPLNFVLNKLWAFKDK